TNIATDSDEHEPLARLGAPMQCGVDDPSRPGVTSTAEPLHQAPELTRVSGQRHVFHRDSKWPECIGEAGAVTQVAVSRIARVAGSVLAESLTGRTAEQDVDAPPGQGTQLISVHLSQIADDVGCPGEIGAVRMGGEFAVIDEKRRATTPPPT